MADRVHAVGNEVEPTPECRSALLAMSAANTAERNSQLLIALIADPFRQ
jgi:hypothetical protein